MKGRISVGKDIFYYDCGQGEALLLIHGMWGDHLDWEPVLAPLAERYRVIAVDLPGFGQSIMNWVDCRAEFFRDQLIDLLNELEIGTVAACGNSFGGQIAIAMALAAPDRVSKLVLVDTGGLRRFSRAEVEQALGLRSESVLKALTPELNEFMFSRLFYEQGSSAQRRYIDRKNARLRSPDYSHYVHMIHRCMRVAVDYCLLDHLQSIQVPVLLIHGDHDPVVSLEWVREVIPSFPQARLVVFEKCGHVPQLEQPVRFVREVSGFV